MAASATPRQSSAERLITFTLGATYWLWLVGGVYMAGPVLGWLLAALCGRAYFMAPVLSKEEAPEPLAAVLWLWLLGMGAMLPILLIGHFGFDLGIGQTIKSSVGWAKGWALLALFPVAGYVLPIRLSVLVRAICRLSRQTLIIMPFLLAAPFLHLPEVLWTSPLKVLGGSGDEYFTVQLYTIEPGTGIPRWQFFAPWSPAAGMVAVIHFLLAREEADARWRWTGYVAAVLMALLSTSRMALIALAVMIPLTLLVGKLRQPLMWAIAAPFALVSSWALPTLMAWADAAAESFKGARADSSRVRSTLGRIATQRWQDEAYWFGHGIVERGPHLVEYMPIGSHHSWYGLLFVKGITGAVALAVPMLATLIKCFRMAMDDRAGRLGLAMILTYWFYSFGENLEVLTYIAWPALLAIGIVLRMERKGE